MEMRVTIMSETVNEWGVNSKTRIIGYDTTAVYLSKANDSTLVEFDKFSSAGKILGVRSIFENKGGFHYQRLPKTWTYAGNTNISRDTTIKGVKLFYVDTMIRSNDGKDSLSGTTILSDLPNLITPFTINGINYPSTKYVIVGYNAYAYFQKEGVFTLIDSLRRLSRKEENICSRMIREAYKAN